MRVVSAARKLARQMNGGKTKVVSKRRLQDKGHNPKYLSWDQSPGRDGCCRSVTKHDRRTEPRTNLFVSTGRLQEQRLQTRKLSWVRVPVEMLGLGLIFPYDSRYVSNVQAYDKLRAIEIEHLM
jgi:hypothetical protein